MLRLWSPYHGLQRSWVHRRSGNTGSGRSFLFDLVECCEFGLSRGSCASTCLCQSCAVVLVWELELSFPLQIQVSNFRGSVYTPMHTVLSCFFSLCQSFPEYIVTHTPFGCYPTLQHYSLYCCRL